ncbi:MAG: P-loop NTPase [Euryarchaeota archaeon]|nr:P-loop NTPase [Euryarchaeota archaeon]
MKIVVSGKGGVGKTTIAGTLARVFASRGYSVIAVDSDPSMNLHTAIGVENPTPISHLKELINERAVIAPGMYSLNPRVDDIPERFSSVRDNLRLIVMGTVEQAGQGCLCPENTFLRALLRHLVLRRREMLILDTEAGVEHLGRSVARNFDLMLVVVEPGAKAISMANRLVELSGRLGIARVYGVANKVADEEQVRFIEEHLSVELLERVPYDSRVVEADIKNVPLVDLDDKSPALRSIVRLSEKIEGLVGSQLTPD